jgi:uncharacterized protein (DUF488 family)
MDSADSQKQMPNQLYTVGHSNHDLPDFLALLQTTGIAVIADVRSSPYSRRFPQFNREALQRSLAEHEIAYVFLGDLLGGRPRDRRLYDAEGWVDYERVRQTTPFQQGIERVFQGLQRYTIALLCSEEDPLDCHRVLMIGPAFIERGIEVLHLRRDGTVQTTEEMHETLLKKTGYLRDERDPTDLFTPRQEKRRHLLSEAYRARARKMAYRLRAENEGSKEGDGA